MRIGVIIVLYQCSSCSIINTLINKNIEIIVIDNSPNQNLNLKSTHTFKYIPLYCNRGIGYAQNVGIREAIKRKCSHLVFLDQDSIIQDNFIFNLAKEHDRIKLKYPNLFAIGPTPVNLQTNKEYTPTLKLKSHEESDFILKNEIISSGSCVAVNDIKNVGLLNESLFIDYVDNEWIWRAKAKGYFSGITRRIRMPHMIGQGDIKLLSYSYRISAPIRYYYQTRNYLWLCTKKYVPTHWKLSSFIKVLVIPLFLPFHLKNWNLIIKNIGKGIKDGLFKRKLYQPIQYET